jgi:hypothetical protein
LARKNHPLVSTTIIHNAPANAARQPISSWPVLLPC